MEHYKLITPALTEKEKVKKILFLSKIKMNNKNNIVFFFQLIKSFFIPITSGFQRRRGEN